MTVTRNKKDGPGSYPDMSSVQAEQKSSTKVMQEMLQPSKEQGAIAQLQQLGFQVEEEDVSSGIVSLAQHRHEKILTLETEAVALKNLTKDLAHYIGEQQEQIDKISTNLDSTKQHAVCATVNIVEADKKSSCVIL